MRRDRRRAASGNRSHIRLGKSGLGLPSGFKVGFGKVGYGGKAVWGFWGRAEATPTSHTVLPTTPDPCAAVYRARGKAVLHALTSWRFTLRAASALRFSSPSGMAAMRWASSLSALLLACQRTNEGDEFFW